MIIKKRTHTAPNGCKLFLCMCMPHLEMTCSIFAEKKQTVHLFDNNMLCFMEACMLLWFCMWCAHTSNAEIYLHTERERGKRLRHSSRLVCSNSFRFYLIFVYVGLHNWITVNRKWHTNTKYQTLFPLFAGLFSSTFALLKTWLECM